jgi:hypothetical protein
MSTEYLDKSLEHTGNVIYFFVRRKARHSFNFSATDTAEELEAMKVYHHASLQYISEYQAY